MKFLYMVVIALSVFIAGCRCCVREEPRDMPGGFTEASVDDERVTGAAGFAAAEIALSESWGDDFSVKKIIRAEQQVVAGMNYRLLMDIEAAGESVPVAAKVWEKLSGERELLSWAFR